MSDDKKPVNERPLDPTRDAADIIGDTTGLTGMTTGNPKNISADPDDIPPDLSHEPGGVLDVKNPPPGSLGVPRESYDEKAYDEKIEQGMSTTEASAVEDIAEEEEHASASDTEQQGVQKSVSSENTVRNVAPSVAGEQSVSGDMPSPEADDDTLANAQAVGTQVDEDTEHPEEIDIARDIDEAEEELRED